MTISDTPSLCDLPPLQRVEIKKLGDIACALCHNTLKVDTTKYWQTRISSVTVKGHVYTAYICPKCFNEINRVVNTPLGYDHVVDFIAKYRLNK